MNRRPFAPQQIGDATLVAETGAMFFDYPLRVGDRLSGARVWIARGLGRLPRSSFRSFDQPILSGDAATFSFFPAIGLAPLMDQLDAQLEDNPIPTSVAVTIVADIAQQLAHSGLEHPLAHPGAVMVGFDGTTRTLLLEEQPPRCISPGLPFVIEDFGNRPWYDDLDEEEDCIGIMPVEAIYEALERAPPLVGELLRSPDEANGRRLTAATTVWRLGSILLHLLDRGSRGEDTRLARLAALREGSIALQRPVHARLRALVRNALSTEPEQRPSSPSAFAYHLQPFVAERGHVAQWLRARCRWTHEELTRLTSESAPTLVWNMPALTQAPWVSAGDLEVMTCPVPQARLDAVLGLLTPALRAGGPGVLISHAQAQAYAAKVGARLPTSEEWTRVMPAVIEVGGEYGHLWEWTSTPHRDGFVVRGGPWRNIGGTGQPRPRQGLAVLDHESWETRAASDVGLRLVRDAPGA